MVPERVPRQFAHYSMVLMTILEMMREDYVRRKLRLERLEPLLNVAELRREVTVLMVEDPNGRAVSV